MRRVWWGITVILVGVWIWASANPDWLPDYFHFSRNWPVLIVLLGVYIIIRSVQRSRRRGVRKIDVISDLERGKIDVDEAVDKLKRGS